MKIFNYELPILEEHYKMPKGTFHCLHTIVDNEIANDLSPDWEYTKAQLICTGFLHRDGVEIFVAESLDDNDFRIIVMDKLIALAQRGHLYSFNASMEHGNFVGAFDLAIPVQEVKPFRAKGWTKDRFFKALIEDKVIPDVKIFDPLGGDGGKCITEWQNYTDDKDTNHLTRIAFHNLRCLLCESVITNYKNHFLKTYNIDDGGFMVGKK